MKQLVFIVESTRQANTDGQYIKATINNYYKCESNLKISFIYMAGKGNYNKRSILKSISEHRKKFQGETIFMFVVDKDFDDCNREDEKLNMDIMKFCEANGYQVIWFVHTIEQVYLRKRIEKKEKTKHALRFNQKQFLEIEEKDLCIRIPRNKGTSNILCVLDEILQRKEQKSLLSLESA